MILKIRPILLVHNIICAYILYFYNSVYTIPSWPPLYPRMLCVLNSTTLERIMKKIYCQRLQWNPVSRRITRSRPQWIVNSFSGQMLWSNIIYDFCIHVPNLMKGNQPWAESVCSLDSCLNQNPLPLFVTDWPGRFSTWKTLCLASWPRLSWSWRSCVWGTKPMGGKHLELRLWVGPMWVSGGEGGYDESCDRTSHCRSPAHTQADRTVLVCVDRGTKSEIPLGGQVFRTSSTFDCHL